jgi:hypothetical protein
MYLLHYITTEENPTDEYIVLLDNKPTGNDITEWLQEGYKHSSTSEVDEGPGAMLPTENFLNKE